MRHIQKNIFFIKNKPAWIFTLLFFSFTSIGFTQDIITLKNNRQIQSKVLEVGLNEVRYKPYDNLNGPVVVIRKIDVHKIRYENGKEDIITIDRYAVDQESQIFHKTQAIKTQFFSPMFGHLAFTYEKMLKVGSNVEGTVGIIGPSVVKSSSYNSDKGVYFQGAMKYLVGQEFVVDGLRYAHPLKGKYVKFEASLSFFNRTTTLYDYTRNNSFPYTSTKTERTEYSTYSSFAINIIYGKQYVLGNIITLEYFIGLGYGLESKTGEENYYSYSSPQRYSHFSLGSKSPLTYTGGFSVGYLF